MERGDIQPWKFGKGGVRVWAEKAQWGKGWEGFCV